jgi:transposase
MNRISRHDVTDPQWEILEPLIPKQKSGPGRKRNDARLTLNGILYVLKTGCAWVDLPAAYGSDTTCWRRLQQWTADGTWERLWRTLLGHLDAAMRIDWQHTFLDGSFVAAKKGGRGVGKTMAGKGSKIMLLTDGQGLPLGLVVDSAQPHEMRYAAQTIATLKVPQPRGRNPTRPKELIADKAYDSVALRQSLHRRGIKVTIPPIQRRERKTPKRGRPLKVGLSFRQRWHVERSNAWMDNCRRLVVRYERKPELYAAFCMLFFIGQCVKYCVKTFRAEYLQSVSWASSLF